MELKIKVVGIIIAIGLILIAVAIFNTERGTEVITDVEEYSYRDKTISANNQTIKGVEEVTLEDGNLSCHYDRFNRIGLICSCTGLCVLVLDVIILLIIFIRE